MPPFIFTLIAKLIDPVSLVVAALLALGAKRWWHVLLIGCFTALIVEGMLTAMQYGRTFGEALLAGIPASTAHAALAFGVRRWIGRRREKATGQA